MRTLCVGLLLASSAFAAAPPALAFTLTWEQGEHSRDTSGSRSTFTLENGRLARESRAWGRQAMFGGSKEPKKKTLKLNAAQLEELRALLAATEGLEDVRVPTMQDVGPVLEASLTVPAAKGAARTLVLEAYPTNDHVRGPKAEILDPEPSDTKAAVAPGAKTYAAMKQLYLKLLGLFPLEPF